MHDLERLLEQSNERFRRYLRSVPEDLRPNFEEDDVVEDLDLIATGAAASEAEIDAVRAAYGGRMPAELEDLYRRIGRIEFDKERHGIYVPSPSRLIEAARSGQWWTRLASTGLVDMILFSWGNDRPELGGSLSEDERTRLNAAYRCIGWYRGEDGAEAATFLYFDRTDRFGALPYHQDAFDEVRRRLREMLDRSPADRTLEAILADVLRRATDESIADWREEASLD